MYSNLQQTKLCFGEVGVGSRTYYQQALDHACEVKLESACAQQYSVVAEQRSSHDLAGEIYVANDLRTARSSS